MEKKVPNVLVVICDDLGVGDFSYTGNGLVATPHLDRFRAGGVDSKQHLSGPLCTPARASLLTGQYAQRTRAIDTYCGRALLDPEVATMADIFKQGGYATGCFGKWHLGDNCPYRPNERGFDTSIVHYSGGVGQPGDAPENAGRESYFDPVLFHDGEPENYSGFITDIIADTAADFIEANKEAPWLAYVGFNAPHTPLQAPVDLIEACRARGATGQLAAYYALVEGIDTAFGRLLARLEATGQRDNTIVIFTSDHGPCPSVTNEAGEQRFNCGLRGQKGHVYEGGARVPMFWQWPSSWSAGTEVSTRSHVIDVLPTLMEACSLNLSPGEFDGTSLLGLIEAPSEPSEELRERSLFMQWHRGDRPVFQRNAAVWKGRWKWLRLSEAGPDELYDLEADPGEQNNLAASEGERCAAFKAAYADWFESVGAGHDYAPLRIHVGDAREPMTRLSRQDWRVRGPDGWSSDHIGYWPIQVVRPGSYEVEFILAEADAPTERGTVSLVVGKDRYMVEAREGQTRYRFQLEFPEGPAEIEGRLWTRFAYASPLLIEIAPHDA